MKNLTTLILIIIFISYKKIKKYGCKIVSGNILDITNIKKQNLINKWKM